METLLRRYLWAVDLVVVAVCASVCGAAASSVAAMAYPRLSPIVPTPLAKLESAPGLDKSPDRIIARNIFCSTCLPVFVDETAPVAIEGPTTLPLALLAVMYAGPPRLGSQSIAVLKDTTSRDMGAFVAGDFVYGATITDIWETRIYLDHGGKTEYLDLVATAAPREPAACDVDARKPKDALTAEVQRGIRQLGEHRYEVQRGTLEAVLANLGMLSSRVRPIPEMKNGRLAGFRLVGVHADGPLALIGIKNGDILSSVNGLEIINPEKVVEAFGKLRSANHLSLELTRGNERVTNEYVIK